MSCLSALPSGISRDCRMGPGNIATFAFTDLDTSFTNLDEAKKQGNWVSAIRGLTAYLAPSYDWENNTPDISFTEEWDGTKLANNKPSRSYISYLKLNSADAQSVKKALNGDGNLYCYEVYQNGLLSGIVNPQSGEVTGYVANCLLEDKGALKDDLKTYKLHINVIDSDDDLTEKGIIFKPNFNPISTFSDFMPAHYDVRVISGYGVPAADTIRLQVTQNGTYINNLLTANWEVVGQDTASGLVDITASYVASSDGHYDILTDAALAAYESITVRINKDAPATTAVSDNVDILYLG